MKKLLDVTAIAKITGFSAQKVRLLIAMGRLRAINTSTGVKRPKWMVTEEALDDFLTAKSVGTAEKKPEKRIRIDRHLPQIF